MILLPDRFEEDNQMKPEDNGGRRSGEDRRKSNQPIDFEDRRTRRDRRGGTDRRCGDDRRSTHGFRHLAGMDRRRAYRNTKYLDLIYRAQEPNS